MFSIMFSMRKILYLALILILFSSCSSSVFKGNENIGEEYLIFEAQAFNGEKEYRISVKEETNASMDLKVERGSIKIVVEKDGDKPLEGNYDDSWNSYGVTSFSLEAGEYILTLKGKDFKGHCNLDWKTN